MLGWCSESSPVFLLVRLARLMKPQVPASLCPVGFLHRKCGRCAGWRTGQRQVDLTCSAVSLNVSRNALNTVNKCLLIDDFTKTSFNSLSAHCWLFPCEGDTTSNSEVNSSKNSPGPKAQGLCFLTFNYLDNTDESSDVGQGGGLDRRVKCLLFSYHDIENDAARTFTSHPESWMFVHGGHWNGCVTE